MQTINKSKNLKMNTYDVMNNQEDYDYIKNKFKDVKTTPLSQEDYIRGYGEDGLITLIENENNEALGMTYLKDEKYEFLCSKENSSINDKTILSFFYQSMKKNKHEGDFKNTVQRYGKIDNIDSLEKEFSKKNTLKP
jgi:hypothetical protein